MSVVKWNRWENNPGQHGRQTGENRRLAANGAVKTQRIWADPSYDTLKIPSLTAAVTDPSLTSIEAWDLREFSGLHGYWKKDDAGSPSVTTLQLWAYDPNNGNWFLVATQSSIPELTEFRFTDDVRGRIVKLLPSNIALGGSTSISFFCSAE